MNQRQICGILSDATRLEQATSAFTSRYPPQERFATKPNRIFREFAPPEESTAEGLRAEALPFVRLSFQTISSG